MGERTDYVCATNHRYGHRYCTPHRIAEDELDNVVFAELAKVFQQTRLKLDEVLSKVEQQADARQENDKAMERIRFEIAQKREETKAFARQLARGQIDEVLYEEMTAETRRETTRLETQLAAIETRVITPEEEKPRLEQLLGILSSAIEGRSLGNTEIMALIDRIVVHETGEVGAYNRPMIRLEVRWSL